MFLHLSVIWFGGGGKCTPPGIHTHPRPVADTHTLADTPRQTPRTRQTATAADGAHPTGMHSCFSLQTKVGINLVTHL